MTETRPNETVLDNPHFTR